MRKIEKKLNINDFIESTSKFGVAKITSVFLKEDMGTKPFDVDGRTIHVKQERVDVDFKSVLKNHIDKEYALYMLDEKKIMRLIEEEQAYAINEKINSYGPHVNFTSVNITGTLVSKFRNLFLLENSIYMQKNNIIINGKSLKETNRNEIIQKKELVKLKSIGYQIDKYKK